jgi:outer membrane protein assembly factor BamD
MMSLFRFSRRTYSSLVFAAVLWTAGCASGGLVKVPPGTSEPDKFLFEKGTVALNDKKWITAREYFRQLIDSYPQSHFRADAKLGLGDTYLGEGTTEAKILAANEYKEFLTFFPTHPRADYAQYKLAMSHFYQMLNPQRDQTETKEAVREFEAFVERYPNSPLMDDVRARMRDAKDRLSTSSYQVGLFYFRNRWYPGAVDRFKDLLQKDPEFTNRDAVYYYLGESELKLSRPAEALPYFERLTKEFETSEFLAAARRRIDEITKSQQSKGTP